MDNRIILFNFASRSRPERLVKAIRNIENLADDQRFSFIIKLDKDDKSLQDILMPNPAERYRFMGYPAAYGLSTSKIHAINRDIPTTGWDILVNMSDDIVWTKQGFDDIIRTHCGPDDFVLFPEPYADSQVVKGKNERISVVSIMGRKYYERDGYVYHPSYKRTHCDNEATEVARIRGRLKEVEIPIFYHEHPSAGYPVKDEQYMLERQTWAEDSLNYKTRKEAGFP
jgi:hypothetical protein